MFGVLGRMFFFVPITNSDLLKCFASFFAMCIDEYKVFGFVLVRIRARSDGGIFLPRSQALDRKPLVENHSSFSILVFLTGAAFFSLLF